MYFLSICILFLLAYSSINSIWFIILSEKSLDLFIEVQGYYTHGKEPYDQNSISHQILVQKYKERYGPNCQAIVIWTIKDVEKRNKAKENNLKYLEIFHKDILKIKQDITILDSIINNFLKDYDN